MHAPPWFLRKNSKISRQSTGLVPHLSLNRQKKVPNPYFGVKKLLFLVPIRLSAYSVNCDPGLSYSSRSMLILYKMLSFCAKTQNPLTILNVDSAMQFILREDAGLRYMQNDIPRDQ
jgi:hypothetical protein